MDSNLDVMMERAKRRVLARGDNPEYFPPGELFGQSVQDAITDNTPTSYIKKPHKNHKRPGRKRGRKY